MATVLEHALKGPIPETEQEQFDLQVIQTAEKYRLAAEATSTPGLVSAKKQETKVSAVDTAKERKNARRRETNRQKKEEKLALAKEQKRRTRSGKRLRQY